MTKASTKRSEQAESHKGPAEMQENMSGRRDHEGEHAGSDEKKASKSVKLTPEIVDRLIEEQAWPELFRGLYSRQQPSHSQERIAQLQEDEAEASRQSKDEKSEDEDKEDGK